MEAAVVAILNYLFLLYSIFIFLLGLRLLKQGLYSITSPSFHNFLGMVAGSPLKGFIAGFILTILWQSSSLTTALTVGFASSGLISFSSALGVVIGANLGTTFTERILVWQLPKWGPAFLCLGFLLPLFNKLRIFFLVFIGLGFLLSGFNLISISLRMLNPENWIDKFLLAVEAGSFYGILWGAAATFLLQSSSAFMALLIALSRENMISIENAVLFFLGADIGTCATSLLAALHGNRVSKLVALSHLFFNVGSAFLLYPFLDYFVHIVNQTANDTASRVVNAHFIYNLLGALFFLPLIMFLTPGLDRLEKFVQNAGKTGRIKNKKTV